MIEIQPCRAKRDVHIDKNDMRLKRARHGRCKIMCQRRDTHTPFCAGDRNDATDQPLCWIGIEACNQSHEIGGGEGMHNIFTDTALHQFAIEHNVIDRTNGDDFAAGVANLSQSIKLFE